MNLRNLLHICECRSQGIETKLRKKHVTASSGTAKSAFLKPRHVQKFGQKFQFDVCRGTEHVIALFVVFAIFNAKRRREQTEREHRERDGLRVHIDCKNLETLFFWC